MAFSVCFFNNLSIPFCAPRKDYTLCTANQSVPNSYPAAVNWDKSTIWLDMKEAFLSYFGTSSRIWLCNLNTSHTCLTPAAPRDYLATSRWLKSKHCYGLIPKLSLWKQIIALQEIPFFWALVHFRCYLHWGKVQSVKYSNLKSNYFLYSWTCTWASLIFVLLVCNHEGF